MEYQDKIIICKCGLAFTWIAHEQKFFAKQTDEKGKPFSPPKRCPYCRKARKAERSREKPISKEAWDTAVDLAGKHLRPRPFIHEMSDEDILNLPL